MFLWALSAGILGAWWLVRRDRGPRRRVFGSAPEAGPEFYGSSGVFIAEDCTWVIEGTSFLPAVTEVEYTPPAAGADSIAESLQKFGSAWGFVKKLIDVTGASPVQAANVIVVEAPVDLPAQPPICEIMTPAMIQWRNDLAGRISDWQKSE